MQQQLCNISPTDIYMGRLCVWVPTHTLSRLTLRSLVGALQDVLECIVGMREYDVPYHVRFAIDTGARQATCCWRTLHNRHHAARPQLLACD
jgi:DNA polymerase elongation subunit (family B)